MQSQLKISLIPFIASLLLLTSTHASAQQFYKWVDSKGSTHYTTTPPPKTAKKLATVDTYGERQNSQVKTAPVAKTENNNSPTQNSNPPDQQQQEANAALEQGRKRS
jgi:hypothetical protein